jgi:hypothetical protein
MAAVRCATMSAQASTKGEVPAVDLTRELGQIQIHWKRLVQGRKTALK